MNFEGEDYNRAVEALKAVGSTEEDAKEYINRHNWQSRLIRNKWFYMSPMLALFSSLAILPFMKNRYQVAGISAYLVTTTIAGTILTTKNLKKQKKIEDLVQTTENTRGSCGLDEALNKLPTGFLD